jgi:beta-glucosidase
MTKANLAPRFLSFVPALLLLGVFQYQAPQKTAETAPAFPWPEGRRAAISLSFDDARPSQIDNGLAVFARHGARATFYVNPGNMKQRLDGWKAAVAAGHEMGNHSTNHPCTGNFPWSRSNALEDYTLEKMREELVETNREVQRLVGVAPATFGYPCGQKFVGRGRTAQSYVPLIAEMFVAGRGWLDENANDPAFCDLAQVMGVPIDNVSFEQIRPRIDEAIARGQWLVFAGHDIGTGDARQTTQAATIDALLAYAKDPAKGIWLDTVQNVASYIAQRRGERPMPERPAIADPRIEGLIASMTLEEKIGQLNMPCVYENGLGRAIPAKMDGCRKFAEGRLEPGVGPGGGFFTLANTILHEGTRQQAEYFNELQRIAQEKTRLKIPLLQTEEGTHGLMCPGGTVFPEGLALGSAWNPGLIRQVYATAAREARSVGIHQLFTLVVEPNRDPRLGRNQEGYSEDPYLCSRYAEAIVEGAQGTNVAASDKVVAGLCHYPGQSQPVSGLERGAMEISERILRETFLPPWVAGIRDRGALGVMATYPAIDAVPTHGSTRILTDILRGELRFQGLVLSEGGGLSTLEYEGLAATPREAGEIALRSGLDVGISYEQGFMRDLANSVQEGRTPMSLVDRAVRRILEQKARLGLFDRRFVDPEQAVRVVHSREHVQLALQAGREGIVLLKNEGKQLPLRKDLKSIAVIGPNADDAKNQLGDYVPLVVPQRVVTVLAGIRAKLGAGVHVTYVRGCNVTGTAVNEIDKAREAARNAGAAVVVVGENEWRAAGKQGTDGEGYDAATLELTGLQEELVKAVHGTGVPTVVVLINGRPLATRWISDNVAAIVEAWLPGEKGGEAVADVLFGDYNPGGRLPITIPRHAGQLPVYYNYKPSKEHWLTKAWGKPYVDLNPEPLYPFGHGLSYTTFEYSDLRLSASRIRRDGTVSVTVNIRNKGGQAGDEVVQLYVRDVVGSVVTPVKQLRGFARVHLDAGDWKPVTFTLGPADLALLDRNLKWTVEPGQFQIMVGRSARDILLTAQLQVD